MNRRKYLLFLSVVILVILIIFQKQLITHLKIVLFITEQFPQIPVKPLGLLTANPEHKKVELETNNGKAVADLYVPNQIFRLPSASQNKAAALILAMGVRTQEKDKPLLWSLADTMGRLGYVVFWPRLKTLDTGQSLPEEPETFVESFKYLEGNPSTSLRVDKSRITFVGFSVGSSTAFVASTDPQIRNKVHRLVFFGGYYNVFDYLLALATKRVYLGEETIIWNPAPDAINHAKDLLKAKGAPEILKVFDATNSAQANDALNQAPEEEIEKFKKYSPHEVIDEFKAKIFILHDKSDTYVPYVESIRLDQALSQREEKVFLISDLFEHVQPNRPINIGELFKLYGFLYQTLSFL